MRAVLAAAVLRRIRPVAECTRGGAAVPCPTVAAAAAAPVVLAKAASSEAGAAALPDELAKAMEYDYQLQYPSVDPITFAPMSAFNPLADRCLASLVQDEVGGAGLGFGPCAHYGKLDDRGQPRASTTAPNATALFNFFPDGKVRNKATGLCVRRVPCTHSDARIMIYDLGPCEEESAVLFRTWKSTFGNDQAHGTTLLGPPLTATATACGTCGPFLMKQYCGPEETQVSCGIQYIPPGWTNKRNMLRPKYEDVTEFTLAFAPAQRSLCGTMVQETLPATPLEGDLTPPWYYFHRYKDGVLRKMARTDPE